MTLPPRAPALYATDVVEPAIQTRYPEPFASMVRGRTKRRLGEAFGLETFGANDLALREVDGQWQYTHRDGTPY